MQQICIFTEIHINVYESKFQAENNVIMFWVNMFSALKNFLGKKEPELSVYRE